MNGPRQLPPQRREDLKHASSLERWTIAWMASVILLVGLAMGSSQAMRTAWIEDLLSLVPPAVFLIAAHFESKPADRRFPFGYQRVNSLAFLIAAVALAALGGLLLFNAVKTLAMGERVTIGLVSPFGVDLWGGWLMIAALIYSVVPPIILGRKKLPVARRLQDKVLHTDALMNKADWMTGLAGIGGVVGLGFGLWWADALAAAFISLDILRDGVKAMRGAIAELIDGAPRALDSTDIAEDADILEQALTRRYPGARIRMRETGRFIRVVIEGSSPPPAQQPPDLWPSEVERPWRLAEVTFRPPPRDEP